jgi:hypothetical protein
MKKSIKKREQYNHCGFCRAKMDMRKLNMDHFSGACCEKEREAKMIGIPKHLRCVKPKPENL